MLKSELLHDTPSQSNHKEVVGEETVVDAAVFSAFSRIASSLLAITRPSQHSESATQIGCWFYGHRVERLSSGRLLGMRQALGEVRFEP